MRDIFGPQQAAKHQHRSSQWSCGFCGKSFYEERYLELHFDNIHKNQINVVSFFFWGGGVGRTIKSLKSLKFNASKRLGRNRK